MGAEPVFPKPVHAQIFEEGIVKDAKGSCAAGEESPRGRRRSPCG